MNYDDELKIPDSPDITPKIVNYISTHHPKFLLPEASVTIEFILLVDRVKSIVLGMEEYFADEDDIYFEYDDAIEILKNLDKDAITNPLSPYTILSIFEVSEDISYREFFDDEKDNVQSICSNSAEYNNRGNAKKNNGMTIEALEDYNRALFLNPDDDAPLRNRLNLFSDSGMDGLAVQDALQIYEKMMRPDCITNPIINWISLCRFFIRCKKYHRASTLMLKCLRDLNKYQIPNIVKKDSRSISVSIKLSDKEYILSMELDDFEDIISMVKEIDGINKKNQEDSELAESIKSEILLARSSIGI
tara:strand:- start:2237 stop:3148 length:912 start_codon:yes stop_codon:yes gene_type:complete